MEHYNIYDEIGRGTHSFVYKARRKRSIEYVAVKSTAKSRMDKILNEVPFLHKLNSRYVLKFFDWYESSNHIWLIFEYCMGRDLLNLITQDKYLPESAVKTFGIELVAGLQYLHANGILYCDLKPANVLIDEYGSLKLADFGLARRIPAMDTAPPRPLASGSPHYMAPELFQQPAVHSFASDFWALGCVLYELRTGRQPFTHTNFSELARMIQTETMELPVSGYEMSPAFCNLLNRLLVKDPYQRISWDELIDHPFWDDLPRLEKMVMPAQEIFDRDAPVVLSTGAIISDVENDSADESGESQHDSEDDGYQTDHDGNNNADNNAASDALVTAALPPDSNQEWELPSGGVEGVLARVDDSDIAVRYYALMSDKIVSALIRGLVQDDTLEFDGQDNPDTPNMLLALRTTTTEALAQVLRHLRTSSSLTNLSSRLKRSIMLFFAKPDILNSVWRGAQSFQRSTDLTIASLNIINGFLDMKLGSDGEADTAAIKASRTLLLERVMTFPEILNLLVIDSGEGGNADDESLIILRAKSLIMLNLGVHLNRSFLLSFMQNHDFLYESGIVRSMTTALTFASASKVIDGSLVDLMIILTHLLHEKYETIRQPGLTSVSSGFEELVRCGPLLIQLCTVGDIKRKLHSQPEEISPESDSNEADVRDRREDEVADLASRCLVFLSQIFGEQLNEVIFAQDKGIHSLPKDSALSSLLLCLESSDTNDDNVVALRVLFTLRNCLRCEGNNALVSQWVTENKSVLSAVKALASQRQPARLDDAHDRDEFQQNRLSVGEKISKTATAIVRFFRSPDQR
ncbi:Serine/threonine-protein kinase RUNKEL [Phytophthora ramorum]|uniref:Serine/threonine-protein kinase RUNKEL n=1 Tax=Phytophthora ramorum TaxID=164328 RepID=UPI0030B761CB|nr:Serine/threonine-protein kinase RUNKEL [Phytophthora ramorum]